MCCHPGLPVPPFILGEKHVRAGAVPVHLGSGPDRPGPSARGAAQNPWLPGPVPPGFPVRAEPHALGRNQRGHGSN